MQVELIPAAGLEAGALNAMIRQNQRQFARYFPGTLRAGETFEAAADYLAQHRALERSERSYLFGIVAPDGDLAGLIFLNRIDPATGVAEAAGALAHAHEGRGLMQQGMEKAFQWGRDQLGLRRIRLLISPDNHRAIAMAEALGFRRESIPPRRFAAGSASEAELSYFALKLE